MCSLHAPQGQLTFTAHSPYLRAMDRRPFLLTLLAELLAPPLPLRGAAG